MLKGVTASHNQFRSCHTELNVIRVLWISYEELIPANSQNEPRINHWVFFTGVDPWSQDANQTCHQPWHFEDIKVKKKSFEYRDQKENLALKLNPTTLAVLVSPQRVNSWPWRLRWCFVLVTKCLMAAAFWKETVKSSINMVNYTTKQQQKVSNISLYMKIIPGRHRITYTKIFRRNKMI